MSKTTFKDHAASLKSIMEQRKPRALAAMGETAVDLIRDNMEHGYSKPVRDTGTLIADVQSRVNGDVVEVGNTLHYAGYVHDGTYKMAGRKYITDALLKLSSREKLAQVARDVLFDDSALL